MPTSPASTPRRPRGPRTLCALLFAVALLVTSCGSGSDGDVGADATTSGPKPTAAPDDTTTTAPDRSTTTATTSPGPKADPTRVPTDPSAITSAYAQAVLDKLYLRYRDALYDARQRNAFDEAVQVKLQSAFAPESVAREIADLEGLGGTPALAAAPGAVDLTVKAIVGTSPHCILVTTRLSIAALLVKPTPMVDPFFVRLTRKADAAEGDVPWRIAANYGTKDGQPFDEDRCGP